MSKTILDVRNIVEGPNEYEAPLRACPTTPFDSMLIFNTSKGLFLYYGTCQVHAIVPGKVPMRN
jgi:hypothetical protein